MILLIPTSSYADCTSPAGPAGRIEYSSAVGEQVFKYCNGTDWVPWAGEPVTGADAPQYSSSSGTPGGSDTQVQFNDSGSFGGDANLVWDKTNGRFGIGTTPTAALDVVGDIHYTGVITDVSDIRMKYDIKPLDSPLRKLISLNGFSFKMIGDPKQQIEFGVAAQDVQKVFPELVHQVRDDGTLGVSYDGLIAPMIESIKELKAENERLRVRVDTLERQQNNR